MQGTPSWDLFLIVFFIVSIGYSFVLQRDKVVVTLLAIYAGIVMAQVLGPTLQQFFIGDKTVANQLFIHSSASPFTIQAAIFILTVVAVSWRSGLAGRGSRGVLSAFELAVFSFLNSALIITAVFSFLDMNSQQHFLATSRLARIFVGHQLWWMIAPIIALLITGGLGNRRGSD